MDISPSTTLAKQRVTRIFRYLEAYHQLRNPVCLSVQDYSWRLWVHDLPSHPCVTTFAHLSESTEIFPIGEAEDEVPATELDTDTILKVRRPVLTPCPTPPASLLPWLEVGWETPDNAVRIRPQRTDLLPNGLPTVIDFSADQDRVHQSVIWQEQRRTWQISEQPVRATMNLFQRLYEVYGYIQREGERLELALGEGILNWRRGGNIHHPVLIQRLQLEFKPTVPEFVLRLTEHPIEFYTALFQGIDGRIIAQARQELDSLAPTLPDDPSLPAFLSSLSTRLDANGEYLSQEPTGFADNPRIGRAPIIFLRNRPTGYAIALESILAQIDENHALPVSLQRIVGVQDDSSTVLADLKPSPANAPSADSSDILFSKTANEEQIQIAERLEQHSCVLVQGPPGTGKTHTIANLVGHLLAQGKTILVTSYSAKALRVLREQIVAPLQPLCVSVLESDSAGRSQLQGSVGAIVERLAGSNAEALEVDSERLRARRTALKERLAQLEVELLDTRGNEYRALVLEGREILPSDAARRVREGIGRLDWLPTPITPAAPMPLTLGELAELYASNLNITPHEEKALSGRLPDITALVSPDVWRNTLITQENYRQQAANHLPALWSRPLSERDTETLTHICESLVAGIAVLQNADPWEMEIIRAGQSPERFQLWEALFALVQEVEDEVIRAERAVLEQDPVLHMGLSREEQEHLLGEIIAHLQRGGKINTLLLITKGHWKQFINGVTVKGRKPETHADFVALQSLVRLERQRADLIRRWDLQVKSISGPSQTQQELPERLGRRYLPLMRSRLSWFSEVWQPLEQALTALGFVWKSYWLRFPAGSVQPDNARHLAERVVPDLISLLEAHRAQLGLTKIVGSIGAIASYLEEFGSNAHSIVTADLQAAVRTQDVQRYSEAYRQLADLLAERAAFQRRQALLRRLETVAPGWAHAIRERRSPHGNAQIPGDAGQAWEWRQMADELARRDQQSPEDLERQREQLSAELRSTTAALVESRAWASQIRRTTLPQRQALMGWLNLVKRIGRGTGKRTPRLQQEARAKMQEARSAVPVWIMPMSRLVENFDPGKTRFDVVIIDEASQADAMGLIPLYMADSVVIVGDNEQVSPDAVGDRLDIIQRLIDEHLSGIPNAVLYDGQRSMYDIALESFGGHICLTEHFRCAAEIIAFSNKLSYNGRIKPLRDMSSSHLRPHIVPYRVHNGQSSKKLNEREADAIAALICAAAEQPEYQVSTFGVISLLGEEQARRIETLLRQRLSPSEYEKHRIMCGMAPQFQGDERDVVFLSMVDSSTGAPLSLRDDGPNFMYKKRYNVAASRARDQMWVVYSMQPDVDLKAGDIRRRLIKHALDPLATLQEFQSVEAKAESPFELDVIRRLVAKGYRVIPQWEVGRYRLDIVVDDGKRRLAIECDGDRYHPLEKLADDMARQAILERLGWTFARIRGSAFFRNPDEAMEPVFERLEMLGIAAIGATHESQPNANQSDLTRRVFMRAAELQKQKPLEIERAVVQEEMILELSYDNE